MLFRSGGDRQDLHERIRKYSQESAKRVKTEGVSPDLIDRISSDPVFGMTKEEISKHLIPSNYIGRCPEQVDDFITDIDKVLKEKKNLIEDGESLKV